MIERLDDQQLEAADAPHDGLLVVSGPSGSGKTTSLLARAQRLRSEGRTFLIAAPRIASCHRLRERAPAATPIATIEQLAFRILKSIEKTTELELIDDVDAAIVFERAAEPLFAMEWAEFIEAQIDPEVPGLRAPQRFLEAAFRLITKLRDAQISPAAFLERALKGATQFYARPPNLAHPDLLYYTKDSYRNSLHVDAAELARQHRREVDLAKILEKLYRSYLELLGNRGCLSGSDAVAQAIRLLDAGEGLRANLATQFEAILIDDAQELSSGELLLLQSLRGEELAGVSLFGDAASAIGTFAGARPDRVFALEGTCIELQTIYNTPGVIERAARHLSGSDALGDVRDDGHITLFRATTKRAEAAFVAEKVIELLNAGTPANEIVLLFRSVANVHAYEAALLTRNVEVHVSGDLNIFTTPDVLDALGLLWNVYDPFAHEWLLRTLSGPAFALSDASLAVLCSEPESGQTVLFEEMAEDASGSGRWDRKRDVRLGWNVLRGDQDGALTPAARARIAEFRSLREQWLEDSKHLGLFALTQKIVAQGLARAGAPGSARAGTQLRNIQRFLDRVETFAAANPQATLGAFLEYATMRMNSTLEACEEDGHPGVVRIMSIALAMGSRFDHVLIPNARAGSFPLYYVPDAFLFSPSLGMIAKENVGDARASRTAKFTYYMFRAKTRESYNREERRAFVYAMRRARKTLTVTASERPTRGLTSPEFLSELQAARLPGAADLSDRWHPAHSIYEAAVS